MRETTVRALGLVAACGYAAFVSWVYLKQPQTTAEVIGGLSATVGVYRIDQQAFDYGLRVFRQDDFIPARSAFERAAPAHRRRKPPTPPCALRLDVESECRFAQS